MRSRTLQCQEHCQQNAASGAPRLAAQDNLLGIEGEEVTISQVHLEPCGQWQAPHPQRGKHSAEKAETGTRSETCKTLCRAADLR